MPLIISPAGKMTWIDDPKKFDEWMATPGFQKGTEAQEREFIEEHRAKTARTQPDANLGVYLSTVTQGGKDGYGIASDRLIKELEKQGIPVSTHYTGQKIAILFHNPYSLPRIEAPYRIIYTMFESDKIPDDWIDYLNAADEVWVPSNWCAKVFAKAGINAQVVPLGYDDSAYTFHPRTPANKTRRDFTFLHYNAFNIRKGFPEVWQAFNQEFKKTEPVKLILKSTLNQSPIPIVKGEYPNVECIFGKLPEKEMMDIIKRSDCFLFPSRGEGFGMTPLETMATGMAAIVPNAHGITEYFHKDYMYEVEVKETCPALYQRYKGMDVGNMVICDIADLRKKMRWAYEHQDEVINMGRKAADYVKNWTYTKTAEIIKGKIDIAMSKPLEEKRLANVLTLESVR